MSSAVGEWNIIEIIAVVGRSTGDRARSEVYQRLTRAVRLRAAGVIFSCPSPVPIARFVRIVIGQRDALCFESAPDFESQIDFAANQPGGAGVGQAHSHQVRVGGHQLFDRGRREVRRIRRLEREGIGIVHEVVAGCFRRRTGVSPVPPKFNEGGPDSGFFTRTDEDGDRRDACPTGMPDGAFSTTARPTLVVACANTAPVIARLSVHQVSPRIVYDVYAGKFALRGSKRR